MTAFTVRYVATSGNDQSEPWCRHALVCGNCLASGLPDRENPCGAVEIRA